MKFLPERKKPGLPNEISALLQILHCLFHCWALLLRLLRQSSSICSCTLWSCFSSAYESVASSSSANAHAFRITASCSSEKKALALHQTGADSEVLLCRFVVFHEIMPSVDALPVKVPFPRHEPSALFAELPSQHRITKIRKYLVGIFQTRQPSAQARVQRSAYTL